METGKLAEVFTKCKGKWYHAAWFMLTFMRDMLMFKGFTLMFFDFMLIFSTFMLISLHSMRM
ncbi:hypothetical protein CUU66_17240 [Peribacillus deserti]|uniref:Uncharacterized protein n=1 Tax=Peribacillus deserti TaxID=673318 RepID=A0A2N5M2U4_9BACI|nr:hypothetical protein CUU66_17240 [Peribacillus deserti]